MALVHINAANNAALSNVTIKQGSALQHLDISNNPSLETMVLPAGLTSAFKDFIVSGAGFAELQDNKILKDVWDNIITKLPQGDLENFLADIDDQDVVNFIYEGLTLGKQWETDPVAQEVVNATLGNATLSFDVNIPKVYTDDAEGGTATVTSDQASVTGTVKYIQPSPVNTMTVNGIAGAVEIENINGTESIASLIVEGSVNTFPTFTGYTFSSATVNLTGEVTVPAGITNIAVGNNVTKATVDNIGGNFVGGTGLAELVIANEVTGTGLSIDLSNSALGKSETLEGAWTNLLNKLGDSSTGTLKVNNGYVSAMIQESGLLPAGWTLDPVAAYTGTITVASIPAFMSTDKATVIAAEETTMQYSIDGGAWTNVPENGEVTLSGNAVEFRGAILNINIVAENAINIAGENASKLSSIAVTTQNTNISIGAGFTSLQNVQGTGSSVTIQSDVEQEVKITGHGFDLTGVTSDAKIIINADAVDEGTFNFGSHKYTNITAFGALVEGSLESENWTAIIGALNTNGTIQLYETSETEYISRYWINDLNEKLAEGQSTLPTATPVITITGNLALMGAGTVYNENLEPITLTSEGATVTLVGGGDIFGETITGVKSENWEATISNSENVTFAKISAILNNSVAWINNLVKFNAIVHLQGRPEVAVNGTNIVNLIVENPTTINIVSGATLADLTISGYVEEFTSISELTTTLKTVHVENSTFADNGDGEDVIWNALIAALPTHSAQSRGTITINNQATVNVYADQLEAKFWNTVPAAAAMITLSGAALTGTITVTPTTSQTVIVSNGAGQTQQVTSETAIDLTALNVTDTVQIIGSAQTISATNNGITAIEGEDTAALTTLILEQQSIASFDATQFSNVSVLSFAGNKVQLPVNVSSMANLTSVDLANTNSVLTVSATTNTKLVDIDLSNSTAYGTLYENTTSAYNTLIAALPATNGTLTIASNNQKLAQVINPMLEAKTWTTNVESLPETVISGGYTAITATPDFAIKSDNTVVDSLTGVTGEVRLVAVNLVTLGITANTPGEVVNISSEHAMTDIAMTNVAIGTLTIIDETAVHNLILTGCSKTGDLNLSGYTTLISLSANSFVGLITPPTTETLTTVELTGATSYDAVADLANWTAFINKLYDRSSTLQGTITLVDDTPTTELQQLAQIINPMLAEKNWASNVASLDEILINTTTVGTATLTGTGMFGINLDNTIVPITSGEEIAETMSNTFRVAYETITEIDLDGYEGLNISGTIDSELASVAITNTQIGDSFTLEATATALDLTGSSCTTGIPAGNYDPVTLNISNVTSLVNLNVDGAARLTIITANGFTNTLNMSGSTYPVLEEINLSSATQYDTTGKAANWNTLIAALPTHQASDPGIVTITNQTVANEVFPDLILKGWNIIPASNDFMTINGTEVGLSIIGDGYVVVGANNVATEDASDLSELTAPYKIYRDENITGLTLNGSVTQLASTPANTSITDITVNSNLTGFAPANFVGLTSFTANNSVDLDTTIDFTGTALTDLDISGAADVTTITVPTTIESILATDALGIATINGLSAASALTTLDISGTALDTAENIETIVGQLPTRGLTQAGTLTTTENADSSDGAQKGWLVYPITAPETVTLKGTLGNLSMPLTSSRNTIIKSGETYSIAVASGYVFPANTTDVMIYGDAITAVDSTGSNITDIDLTNASVRTISLDGHPLNGTVDFGTQSVSTLKIANSQMTDIDLLGVTITGNANLTNNKAATRIDVSTAGNVTTLTGIDAGGSTVLAEIVLPSYTGSSYPNGALELVDIANTAMGSATTVTPGWHDFIDHLPTRTEADPGAVEINTENTTLNALISPLLAPKFWATQIGAIASIEIFNGTTAVTSGLTITPTFANGAVYAVGATSGTSVQLTSGQAANLTTLTGDTAVHIVGEVTGLVVDGAAVTDITGMDIEDLTTLSIQNSKITDFKADMFTTVTNLNISGNSVVTSLDVSPMTALTNLTINNNNALTTLICDE